MALQYLKSQRGDEVSATQASAIAPYLPPCTELSADLRRVLVDAVKTATGFWEVARIAEYFEAGPEGHAIAEQASEMKFFELAFGYDHGHAETHKRLDQSYRNYIRACANVEVDSVLEAVRASIKSCVDNPNGRMLTSAFTQDLATWARLTDGGKSDKTLFRNVLVALGATETHASPIERQLWAPLLAFAEKVADLDFWRSVIESGGLLVLRHRPLEVVRKGTGEGELPSLIAAVEKGLDNGRERVGAVYFALAALDVAMENCATPSDGLMTLLRRLIEPAFFNGEETNRLTLLPGLVALEKSGLVARDVGDTRGILQFDGLANFIPPRWLARALKDALSGEGTRGPYCEMAHRMFEIAAERRLLA